MIYDVIIVGAGITGTFLAHDLSKYSLKVAVLDKASDVANGATMANSAIIHAGNDPKEGTLKAKLNVRGNALYEKVCKDLNVSFKRTSAFVVAITEEERPVLWKLCSQAMERQIPAQLLSGKEAREKEPNLSEEVMEVLELPTTGIIYPWEVAIALMEEAMENEAQLFLNREVISIKKEADIFTIQTKNKGSETEDAEDSFSARYVINAAGVYADEIYHMVSDKAGDVFQITPKKGEYFVIDKQKYPLVSRVIYPVPSSAGKGVLVVPTTHENILLGPNSFFSDGKEEIDTTQGALEYVKNAVQKIVKNIPFDQVIHSFAGLRPTGNRGDFIIEEAEDVKHFINVACIESPGLASAPAISEYVIEDILKKEKNSVLDFTEKLNYKKRRAPIRVKDMSLKQREKAVQENPQFGRIVCRCEQITEGEIVDIINRPGGATTVKGVKKRVRPGMGRCQGGFCEPRVIDILARELGVSPLDIRLDGEESTLLLEEIKGGSQV